MSQHVSSADPLEAAIAEYLDGESSGMPPPRDELLRRYATVSAELEAFFANHDRMVALAMPLVDAGEPADAVRTVPPDATLDAGPSALARPGGAGISTVSVRLGTFGDYELLKELGRGGMGVVYKAVHVKLKRLVALKMVVSGHLASADELERFRLEAQAAAGLTHPGIVPIFEAGDCQGLPYFSMGLVEGLSLAERILQGPMAPVEAVRLIRKVVDAVAYAHSHGVIHRDLKPANILLAQGDRSLEGCQPQITDFGLAKRIGVESDLTSTGQVLGTPSYMPPEQAAGKVHEVGEAADIYALGAILYAMLTGRPPFVAGSTLEVLLQVLESDPPSMRTIVDGVPRELDAICQKCLEKSPANRYLSAAALGEDLDRFLRHEPPEARQATPWQFVRRWVRRQPVLAWHLIGIAVVLVLVQFLFVARPSKDLVYHLGICGTLAGWMAACLGLQWLVSQPRSRELAHYLWSAADALFLTGLLAQVVAPLGLLASGYVLLVCASGLFFRTKLVTVTTIMAAISSLLLFLLRPDLGSPWHYALLFEAVLLISGLCVGYQVWRLEILREYYEERRV
jgi:serine/threonine-protein kinase